MNNDALNFDLPKGTNRKEPEEFQKVDSVLDFMEEKCYVESFL